MIGASDRRLLQLLKVHEGVRLEPYYDTVGKLTLGVGRNLDDIGISLDEALYLLRNDVQRALSCALEYAWFRDLSDERQRVIVDMIFNLGCAGFASFRKMIAAVERRDWPTAADEMVDSLWAHQVKSRAWKLADMMRAG